MGVEQVNFDFLDGIFANSADRYQKILAMMIPEFEQYKIIFADALLKRDKETLHRQHHKLKAQIQSLKLDCLNYNLQLAVANIDDYNADELNNLSEKIKNCLSQIICQLEQKQQQHR